MLRTVEPLPLGTVVDETAARRIAGPNAPAFPIGGATVLLGDDATVIFAGPAGDSGAGGVWDRATFQLRGPLVLDVEHRLLARRPNPPWAGRPVPPPRIPIHLFIMLNEGCVSLGTVRVSGAAGSNQGYDTVTFELRERLGRELLDRVRPPTPTLLPLPGVEWLDDVPDAPGRALQRFATQWVTPSARRPPTVDLSALPAPLAEYCGVADERPRLFGVDNWILPRGELRPAGHDGLLEFAGSHPYRWLLDPAHDDPPVWFEHPGEGLRPEREPLSRFLLQFAVGETLATLPYKGWGHRVRTEHVRDLTSALTPLPLRPSTHPYDRTDFHFGPGLIVQVGDNGQGTLEVHLGATHRSVLRPLEDLAIDWFTFEG